MILPTSIPSWRKITDKLSSKGIDLNLNVDPFNGKHGGTVFYKGKTQAFKIEVFPKNMFLSLKEYDVFLLEAFTDAFEFSPSIVYELNDTDSVFKIYAEWYYHCEEEEIIAEVNRLKTASNIKILK